MSSNLPIQRLARSASSIPLFTRSSAKPRVLFPTHHELQRRTIFGFLNRRNKEPTILDPMSEKCSQRKQKENELADFTPRRGGIASGSIFDTDEPGEQQPDGADNGRGMTAKDTSARNRDIELTAPTLDPRPDARKAWERKMVIRDIRKRGRIDKTTLIARTERQHLAKSPFIKGSIKKLMPLARQIAGKPLDEAMIQMRFSKKKAAKDILTHLERSRDEAVVARGMGLGSLQEGYTPRRMVVQDKKGRRRVVNDETAMYVDEAWVGRGTPDYGIDYRARGRAHRLTKPWTSVSVVLKEEKTRIRQMNERADKAAAKMPWLHLPDRPITRQAQYPLW